LSNFNCQLRRAYRTERAAIPRINFDSMCNENQLVLIGRSGPGFSLMDYRKKRESDSSHRKGRMKITASKTDSRIPLVFDLCVSGLRQFGHVM
jgi:hypothetical protein